jgi:hypothetical protein
VQALIAGVGILMQLRLQSLLGAGPSQGFVDLVHACQKFDVGAGVALGGNESADTIVTSSRRPAGNT